MINNFQIEGYWWLPEKPENKIAGILHYLTYEESDLKLLDEFNDKKTHVPRHFTSEVKPPVPNIILGVDENANKITLVVKCYGKQNWNLSSTFPIIHYKIWLCIRGIHLSSNDDRIFNEIEIELESLTSWINSYPVRLSIPIKENRLTTDFTLAYSSPENDLSFDINDGFELSVNGRADFTDVHQEEITVRQRYIASIKSVEPLDFSSLLEKCYRLQSFLNMATFSHNEFLALRLYSEQHFQELKDKKKIFLPIDIFLKQIKIGDKDGKSGKIEKYLFKYGDLNATFPEVIKRWFSFDKKMMPILRHLTDSIQPKRIFKSVDFLIVIQALEGYHHRFFDKEPEKEKNLEQRLKNLINSFCKEVLAVRDIDIKQTVYTRHYYSHFYNKTTDMQIAEGVDLYHLTIKLQNLLICCFLHELGVDNEKINEILQKFYDK
ncbi:ApeA N-terminal domain 1-containing protein [Sinomicrobium oceani]|uniref:ApeA N-terminal domain 1-containing protein n=1 Tax=Sinomicrobium oceani TaxID=1150368 RepID=UPI00227B2A13|nr:HEPN domain-containing protein [Sinomicrobium oceani]